MKLDLQGRCHSCGQPPVAGFDYCQEHIFTTMRLFDRYPPAKGLVSTEPFDILDPETPEGKLQRLAFRCIYSIHYYEGRDAIDYLNRMLTRPQSVISQ